MDLTLTVVAGPYTGQVFTFNRYDRFLVGRSPLAHFRLRSGQDKVRRVSRLHFLLEVSPPQARLHDLGSHNGTFVNGQRVTAHDLHHGNEIKVAESVLRVGVSEDQVEETQAWALGAAVGLLPSSQAPLAPVPPPRLLSGLCACCNATPAEADQPVCHLCQDRAPATQPIPGYLLLRELGRGPTGVVHLALRQADHALLTVKVLTPTGSIRPGLIDRFLRDMHILRSLEHNHIVPVRDVGLAGDLLYLAADCVVGRSAGQLVKQNGPLPVRAAVRIAIQILQALEYAHARKMVHRGIKPANVLLDIDGPQMKVMLADFGVAHAYRTSQLAGLTLEQEAAGTLGFLAPEEITNYHGVQASGDQYSAAASLYFLLTGRCGVDLAGYLAHQVDKLLKSDPEQIRNLRADLPEDLALVIHQALERDPRKRFPNVLHFRMALRPFAE